MSIYINGDIRIPEQSFVKLLLWPNGDVTDGQAQDIGKAVEVPPHGRLCDLDAMAVEESEAYISAQLKLGDDVLTKAINEAVHAKIVRLIADTPTIIPPDPAEEEPT